MAAVFQNRKLYPVLEIVGDHLESLEGAVIDNPSPAVLGELNRLKNQLINLRRAIWPQREAINELVRGDHNLISEEVGVYMRDTYDHCIQKSEVAEMYRELVTGLMNTYLSADDRGSQMIGDAKPVSLLDRSAAISSERVIRSQLGTLAKHSTIAMRTESVSC
ncbi:CorA family divalent cation transporter [Planctomycetaceae bacterium SH139]